MKTVPYLASLLLLVLIINTTALAQKIPQKEADEFFHDFMQREYIPGLTFAVVKNGKVVHQGQYGFANLSWQAPVDKETVCQTASCSKLFASLLLGRLFDKKILLPEQTLGELLDSIPYFGKPITIKQLAINPRFGLLILEKLKPQKKHWN
ncbi:serine hydrolase domain-containing protein [Adhaeribacter pallidiroseus]|uniref:Beta-lactamase n=1 Tax=Adhaeribacter pallidiroseus TaxID=2072847 RepID=A0A369QGR7_9BACT|nr:serine hydrolase domain-containing protein [Adhaeribacter pallidiroseus]RDC62745.1 Beta-lactamase [Adhaeribacter pallidiroseus]